MLVVFCSLIILCAFYMLLVAVEKGNKTNALAMFIIILSQVVIIVKETSV